MGRARLAALALAVRLVVPAGAGVATSAAVAGEPSTARPFPLIAILAYHHISDDPNANLQTVPASFLREQIRASRAQGWTILSLEELLAKRVHPEQLPPRVLVLTFDDGYRSFVDEALPVLREERVRATLAPITSFVGTERADLPPLLTWPELRRIAARGDVEIASHSHALHQYEPSNPHGDTAPSVGTRRWLVERGRYEDREEYRGRLGADFAESQRVLKERLGRPASVLVWPYGFHNEMARTQAEHAGFSVTLTLEPREVTAADLASGCLPRMLVTRDGQFSDSALAWLRPPAQPVRAVQVDLDALWNPDESRFRARLDNAVTRARALGATHVVLPACADPRRDGHLVRSYAMNHQLPVLADVWSMAAARFAAAGLRVWVRAPSMNLTWAWERNPLWRVAAGGWGRPASRWGTRLSPDLPEARQAAVDWLTDLAVYLAIDGVLFDDDASMAAHERLANHGSRDPSAKSVAIRGLLEECKQAVRAWRPECRFARTLPTRALEWPGVSPEHAIDLEDPWTHDELVVVPLPVPNGLLALTRFPEAETERFARNAVSRWRAPGRKGAPPILFMVPSHEPRTKRGLPAERQQALSAAARRGGLVHMGSGPITSEGELPIGLLERGPVAPPVRAAERR